ncbi:MAG: response regulator [Acidobacteriota bacterium]
MSRSPTILLVEDNLSLRRLLVEALRRQGHPILESDDCPHCLELMKEAKADLAIIDSGLPSGNGQDLADTLLADHEDLRTLIISGYPQDFLVAEGVLRESTPFLQKPFRASRLREEIRQLMSPESDFVAVAS